MSKSSRKKSRCKYGVKNSRRCRRSPGGKKLSRSKSSRCKYGVKKSSRCRRSPGGRSRSRDSKGRFKKKSASKKKSRSKKKKSPKKSPKKSRSKKKKSPKKSPPRKKSRSKKKMSRKKSPPRKKSPKKSPPRKKSPRYQPRPLFKKSGHLTMLVLNQAKKAKKGLPGSLSAENLQKLRILLKAAESCDNKKMKKVFNVLRPESLQQMVLSAMAKDGLNYEDGTFVLA
ncbi:MAG: hypothetical protein L7S67_02775 [Flavobacteriales bacterium]|nr:hypothetical protein [Flavobacteriales bacterium]